MPEITIDDDLFEVHEINEWEMLQYREALDDIAGEQLNPWEDLRQKLRDFPEAIQAAIFARMPHSLFPLSNRQMKQVAMSIDGMRLLVELIVDGEYIEGFLHKGPIPVVTKENRYELFALLRPYLTEPDEEETGGKTLTGAEAEAFVQRMAAQQAAVADVEEVNPPAKPVPPSIERYREDRDPPARPIYPPAEPDDPDSPLDPHDPPELHG